LELLNEGDRRVSIESILLMEFQSGPDAQLKPVKLLRFKKLLLKVMLLLIIKVQPKLFFMVI
jgi:hypothetical protein